MFGFGKKVEERQDDYKHVIEQDLRDILADESSRIHKSIDEATDAILDFGKVEELKKKLANLKLDTEIEARDTRHLIKMKEAKLDVEYKQKELELKGKFKDLEMKLQNDFHDKVVNLLDEARKEMKQVHTQILESLPNVNMAIKQHIGNVPAEKEAKKKEGE